MLCNCCIKFKKRGSMLSSLRRFPFIEDNAEYERPSISYHKINHLIQVTLIAYLNIAFMINDRIGLHALR